MIKINGIEYQNYDIVSLEKNATEAHDYGVIKIVSTRSKRFETNALVDIDGNLDYIVQADQPNQINDEEYEHRVTLFENIARFDKVIPAERIFTKLEEVAGELQLMTIADIFDVYKREIAFYERLTIELYDDSTGYQNTKIPFKEFGGGKNFTTIMHELFMRANATPKVFRNGSVWVFYPQYWFVRKNDVSSLVEIKNTSFEETNSQNYANRVLSLLKNASNELLEQRWFPHEDGYVYPKSTMRLASESSLEYQFDSRILLITKAIARVPVIDKETSEELYLDLDITDHVKTREEFEALRPVGIFNVLEDINARNCIRYDIGGNTVRGLFEAETDRILFINLATQYLINAIGSVFVSGGYGAEYDIDEVDVRTIAMRFKYVRERDMAIHSLKMNPEDMNPTTLLHSQSSSRIEGNRFKRNMSLLADRLGNVERKITRTVDKEDDLIEIYDYVDNFIVVEVLNNIYDGFVVQETKLNENHVNVNPQALISRRLDPYTIEGKDFTTNFIINNYAEVDTIQKPISTYLNSRGVEVFMKTFANDHATAKPVHSSVFLRVDNGVDASPFIFMPLMPLLGDNISFHAQFTHPRRAGIRYDVTASDIEGDVLNYADDDGEVDAFRLVLLDNGFVVDDNDGNYPQASGEDANDVATFKNDIEQNFALSKADTVFPANLDPRAKLSATFQINPVSRKSHIIIGSGFTQFSYLIEPQELTYTIHTNTKPYTNYDVDVGDEVVGATYNVNLAERKITITSPEALDRFALVANGVLVIGFNESINAGESKIYYVNFTLDYIQNYYTLKAGFDIDTDFDYTVIETPAYNSTANFNVDTEFHYNVTLTPAFEATVPLEIDTLFDYEVWFNTALEMGAKMTLDAEFDYDVTIIATFVLDSALEIDTEFDFTVTRPQIYEAKSELEIDTEFDYSIS